MWVFKNKYFHIVRSEWVDKVVRSLGSSSNCIHNGRACQSGRGGGDEQSNLRFVVIFLRLWDAVYTT